MLQEFNQMWTELQEKLVYGILDHPTVQSVDSLYHWNLVVCEDVPAGGDPQPLEPVSVFHYIADSTSLLSHHTDVHSPQLKDWMSLMMMRASTQPLKNWMNQ